MKRPVVPDDQAPAFVSTGRLPESDQVSKLLNEAHERFAPVNEGSVSSVYPALARMEPELFGLCMVSQGGDIYSAGDATHPFTIMSVSKPFMFALICDLIGPTGARQRLGANATGFPFNSFAGVERSPDGLTNPMVNSGAIATTSLAPGDTLEAKWQFIHDGLSRFAGRTLQLHRETYQSAIDTNFRNRGLGWMLASVNRVYCDAGEAVELYTRQCTLEVTARDLAVMGATLACGGFNPVTRQQVVKQEVCHYVLAVMLTAGMYETSGDWLYEIGLPGKSGIGGGIVTVSPGKGGLGTFSPRLDGAGNSVRGELAAQFLSRRLGLDLLTSSAGL